MKYILFLVSVFSTSVMCLLQSLVKSFEVTELPGTFYEGFERYSIVSSSELDFDSGAQKSCIVEKGFLTKVNRCLV